MLRFILYFAIADVVWTNCLWGAHTRGAWKPSRNNRPLTPCCSWDQPLNNNAAYCEREFAWGPDQTFSGKETALNQVGASSCLCPYFDAHRYEWTPHSCELPPWDAGTFCQLLGKRTILIIGDSTSMQSAVLLMNTIHFDLWDNKTAACQKQIHYANHWHIGTRGNSAWVRSVHSYKPDIVIVNTGPHVDRDADFDAILHNIALTHQIQFPRIKLIWRTQFQAGCADQILTYPIKWSDYHKAYYNWDKFPAWDHIARNHFQNHSKNNRHLLDLSPLYLRADAHPGSGPNALKPGDCLHFCFPGPVDDLFLSGLTQIMQFEFEASSI